MELDKSRSRHLPPVPTTVGNIAKYVKKKKNDTEMTCSYIKKIAHPQLGGFGSIYVLGNKVLEVYKCIISHHSFLLYACIHGNGFIKYNVEK